MTRSLGIGVALLLIAGLAGDAGADSLAKPAAGAPALRNNPASVRQAMEDELARSMKDLHMGADEPHPYFIAYTISDLDQATTSATPSRVRAVSWRSRRSSKRRTRGPEMRRPAPGCRSGPGDASAYGLVSLREAASRGRVREDALDAVGRPQDLAALIHQRGRGHLAIVLRLQLEIQPLDRLLAPLRRQRPTTVLGVDHVAQLDLLGIEVDAVDELEDVLRAHAALEVLAVAVAQLAPQELVVDDLARVEVLELVPRAAQEVFLASTTLWTYPLVEVEGRPVGGGKPGPAARMIREALIEEFRGARV